MVNFPSSLDALSNPTAATTQDEVGFLHADQHANANDAIEALEAKVGIGATTPDAAHKTLKATAAGTSAWGYSALVNLGTQTASGGATTALSISSIPSGFKHLFLEFLIRDNAGGGTSVTNILLQVGLGAAVVTTGYDIERMQASGATPSTSESLNQSGFLIGFSPQSGAAANYFGEGQAVLPYYAKNLMNVICRATGVVQVGSTAGATTSVLRWNNDGYLRSSVGVIDRLTVSLSGGGVMKDGSEITLYGVPT